MILSCRERHPRSDARPSRAVLDRGQTAKRPENGRFSKTFVDGSTFAETRLDTGPQPPKQDFESRGGCEWGDKRDSVVGRSSIFAIYLGLPAEAGDEPPIPLFDLAPHGVYQAGRVTPVAGALLPHRFTLTCDRFPGPSAVCFLWHFPAGHPDWPLASMLSCGVPTFLDTVAGAAIACPTRRCERTAVLMGKLRRANTSARSVRLPTQRMCSRTAIWVECARRTQFGRIVLAERNLVAYTDKPDSRPGFGSKKLMATTSGAF